MIAVFPRMGKQGEIKRETAWKDGILRLLREFREDNGVCCAFQS